MKSLILLAVCGPLALFGQCNLGLAPAPSVQGYCVNTFPGGPLQPIFGGGTQQWSGGTPPYHFEVHCPGTQTYVFDGTTTQHTFDLFLTAFPAVLNQPITATVGDAMGCVSNTVTVPNGPSSQHPWTFDDVVNSFTTQLTVQDSANNLFTLTLFDNPNDFGTPFNVADYSQYTLVRNGTSLGGFSFLGHRFTGPDRLVHTSLQPGNYTISFNLSPTEYNYYCPNTGTHSLIIPNSNDNRTNVVLQACLQGALPSGTVMTDNLRSANLIPTTEPYSALGYGYTGSTPGATMMASMLAVTGSDAIEDWVVVELRNAGNPAQVVYSKAALIQRDGDVVDTDGDGYVAFPVNPGNYYVALRHRNHLGVMTGSARALGLVPLTVDFRSGTTACYGTNPRAQVGSVYALWSGDANGDGTLKYTGAGNDRDPIILALGGTTPNNVLTNQYSRSDANLDGSVKYTGSANDRDIILTNVGSTTPNSTRTQQLP